MSGDFHWAGMGRTNARRLAAIALCLTATALTALATPAARAQPDIPPFIVSSYRLPNGWLLRPAGHQVVLPRAPTGIAVSPDRRTVLAVTSGIFDEWLAAVDATTLLPTYTLAASPWLGAAMDSAGDAWVGGGSSDSVYQYKLIGPLAAGTRQLNPAPGVPTGGIPAIGYPGRMVLGPDGRLYVAGDLSVPSSYLVAHGGPSCTKSPICSPLTILNVSKPLAPTIPSHLAAVGRDAYGVALNARAQTLYVSNWADGTNPARAGGQGTVSIVDVSQPGHEHERSAVPAGDQPMGIALSPDRRTLAVADAGDDSLTMLSLDPAGDVVGQRTVSTRVSTTTPVGAMPTAVAFDPSGRYLYVSLSGIDAVEVRTSNGDPIPQDVTVRWAGRTASEHVPHTWIPTGWFPNDLAAVAALHHPGTRLYVSNFKGMGTGPGGYFQVEPVAGTRTEGSLSAIDLPDPDNGAASPRALNGWTARVVENDNFAPLFDPDLADPAANACLPARLPTGGTAFSRLLCDAQQGHLDPRPLHIVYINNENKTFDSYFGDTALQLPKADSNPVWNFYGYAVTPNQHRLAETWSVGDHFWLEGDQSAEGHMWITAGYVTPYDLLTWGPAYDPSVRGNRGGGQYGGQVSGPSDPAVAAQEQALDQPRARIFDELANPATNPLGLTQRIYSTDVNGGSAASADQVPLMPWGLGPDAIGGVDISTPDVDRASLLLHGQTVSHAWNVLKGGPPPTFGKKLAFSAADRARFSLDGWTERYRSCRASGGSDESCQRTMPNLLYLNFPENHTFIVDPSINPLDPTPQSMVADNDMAMGEVAQGLSHSPFWRNTLLLITEDDTQVAGDHVDIHRTFLLAAGGLARRLGPSGQPMAQVGSNPSVLKTIEVLFGLPPLTLFDDRAVPLHDTLIDSLDHTQPLPFTATRPLTPFLG